MCKETHFISELQEISSGLVDRLQVECVYGVSNVRLSISEELKVTGQGIVREASKVERAQERLGAAVSRLESALAKRAAASPEPQLDAERQALSREITNLKQENAALKRVNEQVSERLDKTIGRLRIAIGD